MAMTDGDEWGHALRHWEHASQQTIEAETAYRVAQARWRAVRKKPWAIRWLWAVWGAEAASNGAEARRGAAHADLDDAWNGFVELERVRLNARTE
jgi:hypothetical protein